MIKKIINLDHIIGVNVINQQGEKLGKIEEVLFDKLHGRIAFILLSLGRVFEDHDKVHALPWSMLSYDNIKECFRVYISKDKLINSPGFDKQHLPKHYDINWSNSIYKYFEINVRYPDQH